VLKRYHADEADARFDILPAMDLLGGQVVRLREGDFDRVTQFSSDPVQTAIGFRQAGASWIHVVDLDGAKQGRPTQQAVIAAVIKSVGASVGVEVAGGLRSDNAIRSAFELGASRVVLGTAALRDPGFAARAVDQFGPESVVAAVDVRNGLALGEGWREGATGVPPEDVVDGLADAGVLWFAVTAIDRDGLLRGPDLGLLQRIVGLHRGSIIASGGISSIDDLLAAKSLGCSGAIVGRAIYEGAFDLVEAFAAVARRASS
jgi:phosphoribosylformimino-5-aminoimidazole carboxamide ribotide isomerase